MIKLLILSLLLISCGQQDGQDNASRVVITKVESCSVIDSEESATITCPDGTSSVILKPKDGKDGSDGKDGAGCSVTQSDNGVKITCGDMITYVYNGKDGQDGAAGANGNDGRDGAPGAKGDSGQEGGSCSVADIDNGARIYCEDGSFVDINFKPKKKEKEDAQDNPKHGIRR